MSQDRQVAGLDVVSQCPKNMLNGPCGGMDRGMCEVGGPCVWYAVFSRLRSQGKLDDFKKVRLPYEDEQAV